ncbi:MAG: hypothetical protein PHE79_10325 [Eubacteriales bacterium]|nr:hypothetical protein [Eubacteriales bacterium]
MKKRVKRVLCIAALAVISVSGIVYALAPDPISIVFGYKIIGAVADWIAKPFKERWATVIVDSLFGDLNADIQDVISILSMDPEDNVAIWSMIQGLSDALVPVGFTIASAFILLSFLNKAMLFKIRSYEDVAKVLLFMLLAKVVLTSSFEIMGFLYSATANIITSAALAPQEVISEADKAAMVSEIANLNVRDMLMLQASWIPIALLMVIMKVLIKLVAYGRLIEIYIYIALAPLPLATLASPDNHNIAKKFIQSFIGVCLQGFIMLISCVIFSAMSVQFLDPSQQGNMAGSSGGFLLAYAILLFMLVKSGSWGKQIAGLI